MNRPAAPPRWSVALAITLAVAAFHFWRGLPLAHTVLMQSFNWVFDFDSARFVGGWCQPGADVARDFDISFLARHALSLGVRPLCLALGPVTPSPEVALMATAALCGGVVAALAYGLAAQYLAAEFDRVLLAALYAVSIHPLLMGIIPETFGFALAGIALHFVLLARQHGRPLGVGPAAAFSLFLNIGFTVTNGALNLIAAAVLGWREMPWRTWCGQQARLWLVAVVALLAVTLAGTLLFAPSLLTQAGSAARRVWWTINMARGEPASFAMVVCTFVLYGFVAPAYGSLMLAAPESHPMIDFRAFDFSPVGGLALALWVLAMGGSVLLALRDREARRLLAVVAAWLLANIALHTYWQYRGSVFIYGPHTSFALFVVLVLGYARALPWRGVWPLRGAALLLLVLAAVNNLGLSAGMVDFLLRQPLSP